MKRALPRSLLMLINIIIVMSLYMPLIAGNDPLILQEYKTLCILILTYTGFLNLFSLCCQKNLIKIFTIIISFTLITVAIAIFPQFFQISEFNLMFCVTFFAIILCSIILIILIKLNRKRLDRVKEKIISLLQKT